MDINWGLGQPVDISGRFQQGAEQAAANRTARLRREAMAAYMRDPKDSAAFDTLVGIDPSVAYQLRDQLEARGQRLRDGQRSADFADAAGQYALAQIRPGGGANALLRGAPMPQSVAVPAGRLTPAGGGQNALAALPAPAPAPAPDAPALNALLSVGGNPNGGLVATPQQQAETARLDAQFPQTRAMVPGDAQGPVPMGDAAPMSAEDAAFMRMVKIDPMRAMEMRGAARERVMDNLRQQDELYAMAVQQLANVRDDASYQQLIGVLAERFAPLGVDLRTLVPPTYPGPDGIRALLGRAMTARDQIAAMDRQDRLQADIADDQADNARADRNVDSQIATRGQRASIADRREARIAAGGGRGGGGRRNRRSRGASGPTAVNPQTGERLILRNGQWVPAS